MERTYSNCKSQKKKVWSGFSCDEVKRVVQSYVAGLAFQMEPARDSDDETATCESSNGTSSSSNSDDNSNAPTSRKKGRAKSKNKKNIRNGRNKKRKERETREKAETKVRRTYQNKDGTWKWGSIFALHHEVDPCFVEVLSDKSSITALMYATSVAYPRVVSYLKKQGIPLDILLCSGREARQSLGLG
jgi:hypothetical protein